MLYGNPQITVDPSVKSVWKSSYQGVWHMGDNPAGAPPQLRDAAQSNNGTSNGAMVIGDVVPGNIGNAINFDGSDDYFDVGPGISPASRFTEECWIQIGNLAPFQFYGVLGFHPGGGDARRAPSIFIYNLTSIHGGFGDGTNWNSWVAGTLNNNGVAWNHVVTTYDGTDYKLYINGSEVYSDPSFAGKIPFNSPIRNIGVVDNNHFTGKLDEVRVLSEALTSGWITTEYNNQSSPVSFYSIGGEAPCSVFRFSNICSGAPITYSVPNTSGHTYSWSVAGGTPSSVVGNSITVTWNLSGPYSIQLSESDGSCTGVSIIYNVTTFGQPVGPTLNAKTPDLATVCDGQLVSATFIAGSGGAGCTDTYQYRFDGGSWNSYVPGNNLNTAGHTSVEIQGQRSGCTAGSGCTGADWVTLATWNVNPQPVGPTLNAKTPNLAAVCDGQLVSATFTAGSGGTGCTDVFQYRFDGGSWNSYTPGNNLNTAGHTSVEIQGQRSGCTVGAGCTGTAWVTLATWNVNPQPVGPTLNAKTPNLATVCDGQLVSATFTAGSGGTGCTDVFQYRFDGGSWNSYTPGNNLNTAGHVLIEIQGQRSGCTVGAGCTGTAWVTLATWNVNPQPVLTSTATPGPLCNESVFSYTPTSDIGGASFVWNRATIAGITPVGPTSGTDSPNELLRILQHLQYQFAMCIL